MSENELPIPNYPEWPRSSVAEISEFVVRGTAPVYVESSDILAIGQRCVTDAGFDRRYARPHDRRRMQGALVPRPDDVLVNSTGTGTIGRSCVFNCPDRFIVDGHVTIVRPREDLADGRWIEALIRSYWGQTFLEGQCYSGSTNQVELSTSRLRTTLVPLPALPEQRRIAEILDTADALIRSTGLLIAKQEALKAQLASDLFTGQKRFSGKTESVACQPVDKWLYGRLPGVDTIPFGWRLIRLVECAKLESGHTPSRNVPSYWNGNIPWLSLHDTPSLSRHVIRDTRYSITMDGINNSSARLLPAGTVAFSRTATVGKCVILGRVMATSQDFACYVCGPQVVNRYLLHLFRYMQNVWRSLAGGSTHQTVYMPVFENLQVLLPPVAEQARIADALDAADLALDSLRLVEVKQRALKQGLADDLLTGRVRVGTSG